MTTITKVGDLKKANDTLTKYNSELQLKLNGVLSSLGSDEPITATTTFQDNNGATRTVAGVYNYKSSDYNTQYLIKNDDGTYSIYIERFNMTWNEGAWTGFTYDPAKKQIANIRGGQYWGDYDPYENRVIYDGETGTRGLSRSITIDSLNLTTGAISLKFSASATSEYTPAQSWYVPNPGKPVSTTFSFAGKLKLFDRN